MKVKRKSVLETERSEWEECDEIRFSSEKIKKSASKLTKAIKLTEVNWTDCFEKNYDFVNVLNLENEPKSYKMALLSEDKEKWKAAINNEFELLNKNNR